MQQDGILSGKGFQTILVCTQGSPPQPPPATLCQSPEVPFIYPKPILHSQK